MAITKIHPIKVNLKAALDYIENPDKTDDKMLVSSFGCSYETADIEFQMLLAQAFNKFYYEQRILDDDGAVRAARLNLTRAAKSVIATALSLIGVSAPERL